MGSPLANATLGHAWSRAAGALNQTALQQRALQIQRELDALTVQIYAERAAFCKQRPTSSQCRIPASQPKLLNAAFGKQEHTIRAQRRALAHEKGAVRKALMQFLTNDVQGVAPVRRSPLERSLRPLESRPRVYV